MDVAFDSCPSVCPLTADDMFVLVSVKVCFDEGDFIYVAWLDVRDLTDSFDLSSFFEVDRDSHEVRERGLSPSCSLSLDLPEEGVPDLLRSFCSERFVSGGLGGRSSL